MYIVKVLIVDDNKDVTDLLSRYLDAKGIENIVTNNPMEGLRRIKEQSYDTVLLDISMPDLSGIDIIHTLEKEKILKDQKIVIFSATAFTDSEIQDLLQKQGVQSCIKKPIKLEKLLTAITSWEILSKFWNEDLNGILSLKNKGLRINTPIDFFEIIFWEGWKFCLS